ncbi:hypothetical protein SRB5_01930 [Streptomyces sp. RB5]|uniref:PucR family transcriptional regulator n=1 Tax=Streptomyces smaragdinus TaxID=2585196 RepID=A0A7K0C9G3_9ACTN|nr:PucR family transcriptional regulator [Streptomyces smaragdinus]MQY10089.1 hypothetical protein [Streptomyces smaragdinus]
MSLPTISSLCRTLGDDLTPAAGFGAPPIPVTAVHVSELADPTAYVTGGELLLTTGLTLPADRAGCGAYAARLRAIGIAALGLGLGPVHDSVPEPLADACREAGLVLLMVPDPTPFLTVTEAYYSARAKASEQHLHDTVAAHRTLTNAAVAPDPGSEVLRRLARILGGWAATLTAAGEVARIHPSGLIDEAEALQDAVARLRVAGAHSAASFVAGGRFVALSPLSVESRVVGYLAVGTPRQLTAGQRHVVTTAVALLSIDTLQRLGRASAREAGARCVALLVDLGHAAAARELAAAGGLPVPGVEGRVLAVRGRDVQESARVVYAWCPDACGVRTGATEAWFLLPSRHPDLVSLAGRLTAHDASAAALVSPRVRLEDAPAVRARLEDRLRRLPDGRTELADAPDGGPEGELAARLDVFLTGQKPPVVQALVAYLRRRGQWEHAARDLEVHRNTLRYRVGRAAAALDVDVDDPDTAARLWLDLRGRGLA